MDNVVGWLTIKTKIDTKDFTAQIAKLEDKLENLKFQEEAIAKAKPYANQTKDLIDLQDEISKTTNKLKDLKDKQAKIDQQGVNNFKHGLEDSSKSLGKLIKKVGKYALAVFGIRSAFMLVRNAMNTITQNDEQLKADIDYMKNALAYTLEPIIRVIVDLMKKLMFYVGYIVKAWTGKNIWENASKGLKGANKEAKKLSKTLLGFDELNILGSEDNGGDTGAVTPSFDLNAPEDVPIPSWLQWIVDNKDIILSVLAGIAGYLVAMQFGLTGIQSLGIGIAIVGVVYAVQGLLDYLKEPTWENFGKIITGIGIAVAGVAIAFGAWPVALAAAAVALVGIIISNWDKIKSFLQGGIDWLKNSGKGLLSFLFGSFLQPLDDAFIKNLQLILNWFDRTFNNIKKIFDNIISFIKNVFAGNWKGAWENIKNIFGAIFNQLLLTAKTMIGVIGNIVVGVAKTAGNIIAGVFKAVVNGVLGAIENILNTPIKQINSLIKIINKVPGINLGQLGTFKLPRLATGGIVDVPRTGVNIGGAIAGEAGREGVLPLTNSQTMAELGKEIGKWITLNLNITNDLDGRVLSKRLETISANNNFARNGVR